MQHHTLAVSSDGRDRLDDEEFRQAKRREPLHWHGIDIA
jgi:hypothetical protein